MRAGWTTRRANVTYDLALEDASEEIVGRMLTAILSDRDSRLSMARNPLEARESSVGA